MADIKSLLKDARKHIDDKNYKDAEECCKNILRKDKQNYLALVLLGKSLHDTEQAPLAYQKAIAIKPDQLVAWQGLSNYYERKNEDSAKHKLLSIYTEMLKLDLDDDKASELLAKFGQIVCALKESRCVNTILCFCNENSTVKVRETAVKQILDILKANIPCKKEDVAKIIEVLDDILEKEPNETVQVLRGKVTIQKNNFAAAVEEILHLKYLPANALLREWLCKYLCESYIETGTFYDLDINKYIEHITQQIENSKYPGLLKCMCLFENEQYLEAYKQCVPLINYQQADVTEATLIIKCAVMLKKWQIVQKLATNFLLKAKDSKFVTELKKFIFLSLIKQQKWKQAYDICKDIPTEKFDINEHLSLAECYIENCKDASQILDNLKTSKFYLELQALNLLKQGKPMDAIALLENSEDGMLKFFYLGKAYWEIKQYDKCIINLLKAAKLDSENADIFYYLGNYYQIKTDFNKAKKCYEKAYNLNNSNSNIVKKLSETYTTLNLSDTDFEFLVSAEKSHQIDEPWLNFRLGLHYLAKREWEAAIIHFRNVIKSNNKDVTAFECLADAYFARGSYTSALRAYNKVILMDSNKSSHCFTRIGFIYSLLTQYEDAITTFKKVLLLEPSSMLALKGISETWIRVAKKKESAKLYGTARDCAQNAIEYIVKALSEKKEYVCFWKLLGDTLMFITKLPNKFAYVFMKESIKDDEIIVLGKVEIFPKAITCYAHIAKQKQQQTSYDLASAYLAFYHETNNFVNIHIAYKLAVTCIKEKPTTWRNWNILGKICLFIKRFDIAQHCFIKALTVTRKWSVAKIWCNLGTLYIKLNIYKIANYCFWRGQSTLPSYPQSWIGQGLIAEVLREEEAMDLFRHASRLGYHPESALGYADWVCRTLRSNKYYKDHEYKYVIDGLHAITYAIDLIEWFSNFESNNPCACNILGILQERSGLLKAALKSYEKALQYSEDDKKNIILLNIARVLLRIEKYDEAIKVYKAITEASLNSTCGLALALFKKGLYEESYSVYDTALHWLSNDDNEKAELLVAMAGIIYMYKGADDAKTILFHSIQLSPEKPNAYSLFGICSLGIIHSEQSLTKLALTEMKKYEHDTEFGYDIGFLKSYIFVKEGNVNQAIKLVSDSLHDHPNNALLWFCLAEYCLKITSRTKLASCSAQRAICSTKNSNLLCNSAKMIATASIAEQLSGNKEKALNLAKNGLHMYPNNTEVWSALLLSLMSHKVWKEKVEWILSVSNYLRRHLEISRPMSRWVSLLEKKIGK